MFPSTLPDWIALLEATHVTHVDLGLTRMQQAITALDLLSLNAPVITVAGTNGKGSVVCALENIYHAAGYRVGSYISPHLFIFNERVKLGTQAVSDDLLCDAFVAVYAIAQQYKLTYFEVITLAGFWIFKQAQLDIIILEVGLGGRLDAVNVIDPNVAVITSIDLDHTDRLGHTREIIAKEKAGIFRKNTPVVCGDQNPPMVLKEIAESLNAPFYQAVPIELPDNGLLPENMNTAVTAAMQLQSILPLSEENIKKGLLKCHLPGRQQIIYKKCKHIFDVAHNPAGLKKLAQRIVQESNTGRVLLVIGMLKDKDLLTSFSELKNSADDWFVAPIKNERAANNAQLKSALDHLEIKNAYYAPDLSGAYLEAMNRAQENDIIVVTGSFYTVSEIFLGNFMIKHAPPCEGFSALSVP
jgi:dihydrofolate synthase/folylpolyglutamate synthase